MKLRIIVMLVLLAFACSAKAQTQDDTLTATADVLRLRLIEVQAKETELRIRLEQLDEDLKPENIERALAGIGSTRPEDLRAQRRRLLLIERGNTAAQLKVTESNRSRLEAAIAAAAEAESYQPVPQPTPAVSNQMILNLPFVDIIYEMLLVALFGVMALAILGLKMVIRLRSQTRRVER
jgi:hypothetical protein